MKIDAVTGQALSKVRRLTQWSAHSAVRNVGDLSTTADGKRLVLTQESTHSRMSMWRRLNPAVKTMKIAARHP